MNFQLQSNKKLKTWTWKKARILGSFHGFWFQVVGRD